MPDQPSACPRVLRLMALIVCGVALRLAALSWWVAARTYAAAFPPPPHEGDTPMPNPHDGRLLDSPDVMQPSPTEQLALAAAAQYILTTIEAEFEAIDDVAVRRHAIEALARVSDLVGAEVAGWLR